MGYWQNTTYVSSGDPARVLATLAFLIDPTAEGYQAGMSLEETAHLMATGSEVCGFSRSYLENLVGHFDTLGIEDDALGNRPTSHGSAA